jgi:L-ribulose-5-phosphate 3-epimerase
MLEMTRRTFIGTAAAAGLCSRMTFAQEPKLRIGATDWNLKLTASPLAVPLAAKLGFDGIQVSFGRKLVDGKMPGDDPEITARYLALSRQYGIPIDGTCCDRLHDNGLKSDPLASKWVLDAIRLTAALNVNVLLLPFSGPWALLTQDEKDRVGDALRDLAPEAAKVGVVLGVEDLISAEDNVRILDRARADNVKVYYDVGNSTQYGFDPLKEIPWLGKDRICQYHLKDNPHYLGEGKIQFPAIIRAILQTGYSGYANLETESPSGDLEADMSRNLAYIRDVIIRS